MRGPYGAGAVAALHSAGFGEVFETVVGISTGAATGAYFLGGAKQIELGASLYYEECTQPSFMNPWRLQKKVDIDLLVEHMRTGKKALNVQAIQDHPTQFFVSAITRTGQQELINVKTALPDSLTAIKASMALPGLYGKWITVNGKKYCDGGFNQPIPIKHVSEKFRPTDILILPNQTRDIATHFRPGVSDVIAGLLTLRQLGLKKSREVYLRKTRFRQILETLPTNPNIAILWPSAGRLHEGTRDPKQLLFAFEMSRESTREWIKKRQLQT